jgi:hypothetical protein
MQVIYTSLLIDLKPPKNSMDSEAKKPDIAYKRIGITYKRVYKLVNRITSEDIRSFVIERL